MNKRLKAIFSHIENGIGVIDVGTDHGYIPVALCESGYPGNIIASDIHEAPLETARKNAAEAGYDGRIEFVLCDGLEGCDRQRVDTIVIAGMGGDTICGILDRDDWCIAAPYTLILQPMTKAEILRYWLISNGFAIVTEDLVIDGILYPILVARAGESVHHTDAELYTGKFELAAKNDLFASYLDTLIKRFEYTQQRMKSAVSMRDKERMRLDGNILSELYEMRDRL